MKYPRLLSSGANNKVIALTENEVAKLYEGDTRSDIVLLTHNGIRLIDVGISALQTQVGNKLFEKYIEIETGEMQEFKTYFLSR